MNTLENRHNIMILDSSHDGEYNGVVWSYYSKVIVLIKTPQVFYKMCFYTKIYNALY